MGLLAVLVLAWTWLVTAMRGGAGDRAARVLARAVGRLPETRAPWGQAMLAELDGIAGARERWAFSLGCVRAALVLRLTAPQSGDRPLRVAIGCTIAAALALPIYGLVSYPALRVGGEPWVAGAFLGVLLSGYAGCALLLAAGPDRAAAISRGSAAGLLVGGAWLLVVSPPHWLRAWVAVPLVIALLAPAGIARTTSAAAIWAGLVGGLVTFVVLVTTTYIRDGRPYDAQLVRDFRSSHAHDLAGYAVQGNLGVAFGLLLLVPLVSVAFARLGGEGRRGNVAGGRSAGHGPGMW